MSPENWMGKELLCSVRNKPIGNKFLTKIHENVEGDIFYVSCF